jgi:hypothetical protein
VSLWITAYCCRPVGPLAASALKELIEEEMPDWDDSYSRISVTRSGKLLHLNYRLRKDALYDGLPAASRERVRGGVPIVVDQITDPADVEGMVREQLEDYLKGRRGQGAKVVRDRLAGVHQIYAFCLKQSHYDDRFGQSVAFAAAQGLARKGKGLFREDGFGWLVPTRSDNVLLLRCS